VVVALEALVWLLGLVLGLLGLGGIMVYGVGESHSRSRDLPPATGWPSSSRERCPWKAASVGR